MNRALYGSVAFYALCWACASIQSPTGGPKDKRPPRLISSVPPSNQANYSGATVLLTFDETVKLNSPREEIIISPSTGAEIEYKVKNNRVFITPKSPWAANTTYSILFREGIQDITEGNTPPNLKLAFSTGPFIDSLSLAGQVTDMLLGTPKEKITVAIYSQDTFDIFRHAPIYFTQTDKYGSFRLDNLAAGSYFIYAFDDKNKNLKVESRAERFGFLSNPVYLKSDVHIDTLSIGVVQLDTRPLKISSVRNLGHLTRITFSKSLVEYNLEAKQQVISAVGDNAAEVNVWNPPGTDSILLKISAADSLEAKVDSSFYIKRSNTKSSIDKFTATLGRPSINPETGKLTTTISFTKPATRFQFDSLYIKVDTTSQIPISQEDVTWNQATKKLVLSKDLGKKMFGPDDNYFMTLMMKRAFALSADGDTTKAISAPITIFWPEENGTITVQANTKEKNYILQLIEEPTMNIVAQTANSPRLMVKNIPPTDYLIRAIVDRNGNGKWDPGNIIKRLEPEQVFYYSAPDGKRIVPMRANWEVGPLQFSF